MVAVEICLCSDDKHRLAENVAKVYHAGAARIELCSAMEKDGLTPDLEAISIARRAFGQRPGLIAMIRPRGGDFTYNDDEVTLMLKQIEQVAHAGVDGVVFGALTADKQALDLPIMKRLITVSRQLNLQIGIHRAFDAANDRQLAMAQLLDLGVDRLLTSGTPWGSSLKAVSGISTLLKLVVLANQKIEMVIAGGITASSAKVILEQLAPVSPEIPNQLSLHAYSSVLVDHCIESKNVADLVNINL
jgi:copper homeostasis protein